MTRWGYVYLTFVTLVMVFLIYRYSDLVLRIRRQKKRYDILLRGRGEYNLEELLKAHSQDIDVFKRKIIQLEAASKSLSEIQSRDARNLEARVVDLDSKTNTALTSKMDKIYNDLDRKIDYNQASASQALDKAKEDFINKNKNLESAMNNKLANLDKKYYEKSNEIDSKYTNEIHNINIDRQANMQKLTDRLEFDVKELKEADQANYDKLIEFINKQNKALDDNIALAIQYVSLYKYNALQNQSGDLSFTMVLLDRMYNGYMLTSINARDASYTYSKEIKNGKSLVAISPEEAKALDMVVKTKA